MKRYWQHLRFLASRHYDYLATSRKRRFDYGYGNAYGERRYHFKLKFWQKLQPAFLLVSLSALALFSSLRNGYGARQREHATRSRDQQKRKRKLQRAFASLKPTAPPTTGRAARNPRRKMKAFARTYTRFRRSLIAYKTAVARAKGISSRLAWFYDWPLNEATTILLVLESCTASNDVIGQGHSSPAFAPSCTM